GTYVTTPSVSEQSATVQIATRVRNESSDAAPVNLANIVYDAAGREVTRMTEKNVFARSAQVDVNQTIRMPHPALWSDENPYLYKVVSQLEQNKRIVDRYETPLGIRSFSFEI